MATYSDIVAGALRHLGVRAAESPITAQEAQDGLEDLNDMGIMWADQLGIAYTPSTDINATIDIAREHEAGFKSNLAIMLAPQYSRIVSPALAAVASEAYNAILISSLNIDTDYPDTLPKGSGNYSTRLLNNRFFPQNNVKNY